MKPAKTSRPLTQPVSWSDFSAGDWLCLQLQQRLDAWCCQWFGYHLLKVGALSGELSCQRCLIRHQVTVATNSALAGVRANLLSLPFQEASVDACLLAHSLEYCGDPHQLLREIERVLTLDGHVVISGFNPISLVGISRWLPNRRRRLPWSGRMFTPGRIKDWLHLLGFEVLEEEHFGFSGLAGSRRSHSWLEQIGNRHLPQLASVYLIHARKRKIPITPIRQRWGLQSAVMRPGLTTMNAQAPWES